MAKRNSLSIKPKHYDQITKDAKAQDVSRSHWMEVLIHEKLSAAGVDIDPPSPKRKPPTTKTTEPPTTEEEEYDPKGSGYNEF